MKIIPLQSVPSQTVSVVLDSQSCRINVYQKDTGLYFDLLKNGVAIVTCRICRNKTKLIRHKYLGFLGDLFFFDTQGSNDPTYTGLADRYLLAFLTQAELEL